METNHRRHAYTIAAWSIILLAIILGALAALLPQAWFSDQPLLRSRTAGAVGLTVVMVGAACMMVGALKRFKRGMRLAYMLVAMGFLLLGISLVQVPVIGFVNTWNTWFVNSGVPVAPFLFAAIFIYAGIRRFAIIAGNSSLLTSFVFTTVMGVVWSGLAYGASHYVLGRPDIPGAGAYIAMAAWSAWFATASAALAWRITNRIGPFYQPAMGQLAFALMFVAAAAWHESAISFFFGNPDWYIASGVALAPLMLSGLLLIRATHTLGSLATKGEEKETSGPVTIRPVDDSEYTNAITYAASLTSHPADIDFILDGLRMVTANLEEGQALSPEDKRQLINVYLKVELFLMYHDQLRNISRQEIRSRFSVGLQTEIERQSAPDPLAVRAEQAP